MKELVRTEIDKVFIDDKLGKPMTPGNWTDDPIEYIPITEIRMSCGGGMGGCVWSEYIQRIDMDDFIQSKDDFIKVVTYKGEEKILNKRYIVMFNNSYEIVKAKFDSKNYNFEMGIYTIYKKVNNGQRLTKSKEFGG